MPKFKLNQGDKFAILAVEDVYSKLSKKCEEQLSDGTWVLDRIPVTIEANWKGWLGSIRWEKINKSNAVLIRTTASSNPQILDHEHARLSDHLTQLFYLLQLSGGLEYNGGD